MALEDMVSEFSNGSLGNNLPIGRHEGDSKIATQDVEINKYMRTNLTSTVSIDFKNPSQLTQTNLTSNISPLFIGDGLAIEIK